MDTITQISTLGSKENPHPITPWGQKDRKKGHYYIYKNELRYWSGRKLVNREKQREYDKKYFKKNKDKIYESRKENSKEWRENNREKIRKQWKEWRKNNREKMNEYQKKRIKNDTEFRLTRNTRHRVYKALKGQNASKNQRTMEYVNCSVAHLHNHIESQFKDSGMNWDNMGREDGECGRGWEVDHRRPCASFDLKDEEQKYMCFHWTNLQPMWQTENLKKGDKFDPETFQYKWIDREIGWVLNNL